MEHNAPSASSPAHASTSQHSMTFGSDPFIDDSPVRVNFFSPRPGSSFWKRRRRSFVDPLASEEVQRIRALGERLSHADTALKTYLDFRLNFAEDMCRSALILLHRRQISKSISASSSVLFGASEGDELAMQRKQRGDALSDLNQRCYARLSERTASEVKRHVMCEEATPPLVQMKCCNRYACAHSDEGARRTADFVDHAWLSNGSSLVKAYSTLHELCRTDSAVVYSARHRQTGVVYCIKRSLRRPCAVDRCDDAVQNALNECQALSVLRHTNIVRFHNSWIESGSVMLQMEYCLGGSLHDCLHGRATTHTAPLNPLCPGFGDGGAAAYQEREGDTRRTAIHGLPVTALTKLLGDVASALEYMHTKWYMAHRNVGMRTILVQLKPHAVYRAYRSEEEMEDARRQCHELLHSGGTAEMDFKLAGFGVASRVSEAADSRSGDVYALGVTLCFAARGDELPHPDNEVNEVDTSTVPASLQPILQLMLRPLAVDRVTASGVLEYLVAAHSGGDETEEMDVH